MIALQNVNFCINLLVKHEQKFQTQHFATMFFMQDTYIFLNAHGRRLYTQTFSKSLF